METPTDQLPTAIREIYHALKHDVIWLHARWTMSCQLFGGAKRRRDLLRATAPVFFSELEETLIDNVTLGICRLTDPAQMGRNHRQLSLEQLVGRLDPADSMLRTDLQDRLAEIRDLSSPLRNKRDKVVAHADLPTKLTDGPLHGVEPGMVDPVLAAIVAFLNRFEGHFGLPTVAYEHPTMDGDGESVIWALKRNIAYHEAARDGLLPTGHFQTTSFYDTKVSAGSQRDPHDP